MNIIASHPINVGSLITNKYKLEDIGDAFKNAMAGNGLKTAISFE
jgi:Zn-dependent alcohol dehydrogenase